MVFSSEYVRLPGIPPLNRMAGHLGIQAAGGPQVQWQFFGRKPAFWVPRYYKFCSQAFGVTDSVGPAHRDCPNELGLIP
jgi:hypothetical protein